MLINGVLFVAVAIIIVSYILTTLYNTWSWVFKVPGPSLFKIENLGNVREVFELKHKFGDYMVNSYGRIYRLVANGKPVLVLADPLYCQQLTQGHGVAVHEKGLGLGRYFERYLGDSMACLNGKDWSRFKKIFRPALSPKAVESGAAVMKKVLDEWEKETVLPVAIEGKPIDVTKLVGNLPMKAVTAMLFGYEFATKNEEKINQLKKFSGSVLNTVFSNSWAAVVPLYEYFTTKANVELNLLQKEWLAFLISYLTSKEREDGRGGLFDRVVEMAAGNNGKFGLSKEIVQTMMEIVFANNDVVVPSYAWMLAHLAVYPDTSAKLAITPTSDTPENMDTSGNGRLHISDKSTLENDFPQILDFINESARVNPFIVLKTMVMLETPTKIGDHVFPMGTRVSIDNYSMNHHPKYWKNPDEFNPSRFVSLDDFAKRWCFSRFGHGVRVCPGQYHADVGMANTILRIVSNYNLVIDNHSIQGKNGFNSNGIIHHKQIPVDPDQAFVTPKINIVVQKKYI